MSELIRTALDPARSVVVEACAGSGKTWLLAARIVRLLLAGVAPGEILAITFTRKAAREIEERVVDWLHLMATGDDAALDAFLVERGVAPEPDIRRRARGLFERVLAAQPQLAVNTFHGWFLQLVDAAPLSANLAGATLVDADSRLFDELWQQFAARLQRTPEGATTQAFVRLLEAAGLEQTRRLMRRALDRRSEWLSYGEAADMSDESAADVNAQGEFPRADAVLAALAAELGAGAPGTALAAFFVGDWAAEFHAFLGLLESSELKGDQESALTLRRALAGELGDEARFAALLPVFLTQQGTLRSRKPGKALDARYTPAGAARFLALHAALGERLLACREAQLGEAILAFNADACRVFAAFLAEVDAFKRARRQIDFSDAEWTVLRLLRDEATAAFLQARLDARYRHVLLDEFQDTNPLQWQILLAWLAAYSDAARPGVFLVGDPKQSIYRFRRAEPRLFGVARDFLVTHFDAVPLAQDVTRRNAPAIVEVVNALFAPEALFAPFRPQASLAGAIPGRVELLPLCGKSAGEEEAQDGTAPLRDPLREPAVDAEDARRAQEAAALAARILAMVGRSAAPWLIETRGADGRAGQRPLRYGDIMLLVRTRTQLSVYERALAAARIPFAAGSRGGLLDALEARDLAALLEFLVTPRADLALAHALRAPLFACSDDDLLAVSGRSEADWWTRLAALVAAGEASPHLARAQRLLSEWLPLAAHLPAHDLIDRIYHQGEVVARYRRAVPEAERARVVANLDALLHLALDLDGGRYPSLPRFLDELRELRAADDAAPDEGEIALDGDADADGGRVRILTIHGAKGLEAPVVWLLDANASPRPGEAWDVLVDWPPEAAGPTHFSFYGTRETRGAAREPFFAREAEAARREELNLLYVAITRARQVFIASGSAQQRSADNTPYRLLGAALARLHAAAGEVGEAGAETIDYAAQGMAYGGELPCRTALPAGAERAPQAAVAALPEVGARRAVPEAGARFGILLHALLERRTAEFAAADAGEWWRGLGFSTAEYRRVLPLAERLLTLPAAQPYFDPARYRHAWNEVEIGDGQGGVLRLDRLVERDDGYHVLDYKSSASDTPHLAAYRAQVAGYCRALAAAFPERPVYGALLFADGMLLDVQ